MAPAPLGPLITQPVLLSTRRMCSRWIFSRESVESDSIIGPGSILLSHASEHGRSILVLTALAAECCGGERGFGSTPFSDRITERSTRFCSSRTLPGQSYAENA